MWVLLLSLLASPARSTELLDRWVTVGDGLPVNWTTEAMQDDNGLLWIGGPGTVARYDGSRVRTWRAPDESNFDVDTLVALHDGTVVARQNHDRVFVIADGRSQWMLGPRGEALTARGLDRDAQGRLLVARDDGLWRRDADGSWLRRLDGIEGRGLTRVAAGAADTVWLGTQDGWFRMAGDDDPVPVLRGHRADRATTDAQGRTWLLTRFPAAVWRVTPQGPTKVFQADAAVGRGLIAHQGSVWFGYDSHLMVFHDDGTHEQWGPADGSRVHGPKLVDREGSIWFTSYHGLAQLSAPTLRRWTALDGLPVNTSRFVEDHGGALWVATWQGLARIRPDGLVDRPTRWIVKGRMCHTADGGLWTLAGEPSDGPERQWMAWDARGERHTWPASGGSYWAFGCDSAPDGSAWFVADDRVWRATGLTHAPKELTSSPVGGEARVRVMLVTRQGEVWIGAGTDVCHAPSPEVVGGTPSWTCAVLPGTIGLGALLETERGHVWAATRDEGLLRLDSGEPRPVPGSKGLAVRDLRNLVPSPRGGTWVLGLGAVVRVIDDPDGVRPVEALPEWLGRTLSAIAGLHEADDGTLWLATNTGVVKVPARLRHTDETAPSVHLAELLLDGEPAPTTSAVLPSPHATATLHLATASFRAPGLVRYRHRVDGGAWSAPSAATALELAALGPGTHLIEMAASNDGHRYSTVPTALQLTVPQPWYRSTWFWMLAMASVAATALGIQQVRHRLAGAAQQLRTRVAMDLHDELGAGMASMGLLAGLIAQSSEDPRVRGLAQRIATSAEELGIGLSGIVWSLRTEHDSAGALLAYIEHRARSSLPDLDPGDIGVLCPPDADQVSIDLDVLRALQLVSLEALHNVSKHAQATKVWIHLEREGPSWRLVIGDNGVGVQRSPTAPDRGLGLQSMAMRLTGVGGALDVGPGPDGGTLVVARFRGQRPWWRRLG